VRQGPARVLALAGELDMHSAGLVVEQLAAEGGFDALTLDLRGLAFMDSSGLRFLIELNRQAEREGWRLALVAPTDEAARLVLQATGADKALPFEPGGRT
jgi:anti-sigma B factor antagonist